MDRGASTALAAAMLLLWAPAASADRYEASLALEAGGGFARVGERGTQAQQVPAFGVGGRLTHAWSNTLAWDVTLAGMLTQPATFPDAEAIVGGRLTRGSITRRTVAGRAELGAELRLGGGAGLISTLRLGLGPQLRYRNASDLGSFVDGVPATTTLDAVATLGGGVDVRVGRRRVVGIVASATHAQPLGEGESHDAIVITVRLATYWYPKWWTPAW